VIEVGWRFFLSGGACQISSTQKHPLCVHSTRWTSGVVVFEWIVHVDHAVQFVGDFFVWAGIMRWFRKLKYDMDEFSGNTLNSIDVFTV
jgi:hypothetical protein